MVKVPAIVAHIDVKFARKLVNELKSIVAVDSKTSENVGLICQVSWEVWRLTPNPQYECADS